MQYHAPIFRVQLYEFRQTYLPVYHFHQDLELPVTPESSLTSLSV